MGAQRRTSDRVCAGLARVTNIRRNRTIPAIPGTYFLVLRCRTARTIGIGCLGKLHLRPGWYVYIGSAFGPGGLRARIAHHRRLATRPHWHIDYLRRFARLEAVWYCPEVRCEHEWAAAIGAMPGAAAVGPRFGSSDCGCETHLWRLPESDSPGRRTSRSSKAATRLAVNDSPEPFSNVALSLFEDALGLLNSRRSARGSQSPLLLPFLAR